MGATGVGKTEIAGKLAEAPFVVFIFLLVSVTYSRAGEKDSLRSVYIHKFSDHMYAGPLIKQQDFNFSVISPNDPDLTYEFLSNTSVGLGAVVNIFNVNLEAAFSIPVDTKDENQFGISDARDFQVRILSKRWIADVFSQRYRGFYVNPSNVVIPAGQPFPQRSDMITKNVGLSFAYAFNFNQFSLRAPYIFIERQKSSKGSWLIGSAFSTFTLTADSSFIPSDEWSAWGQGSSIAHVTFTSLGLAPGYSHTFIVHKFFLNLLLVLGPAHYWVRYTEIEDVAKNDIRINLYSTTRVGIGYNGDKFFGGINISTQIKSVALDESIFQNNTTVIRVVAGMRILEKGIFKKGLLQVLKAR